METITSALSVLPTTTDQVVLFSSKFIDELANGVIHPFEAVKLRKSMDLFFENIKPTLDQLSREEAEKYGAKEFESHGLKIVLAENGTKYDYSKCNDPVLIDLQIAADNANERLKGRQKFLQGLNVPMKVDDQMSDSNVINPPVKSSTSGLRVSLK